LKVAGGAVVAVLLTVALVGAVMPQEIPELIEAGAFRVTDENGTVRAAMGTEGISYYDENGTLRALMAAPAIVYFDEKEQWRGVMNANRIAYYDAEGNVIWQAPR